MDVFGMKKNFYITRKNVQQYAEAISQFLKDYLEASGMDGYVLGLSGGLDSAVAAYLARYANIPLYLLMMPYGDTMEQTGSGRRALEVVEDLGLEGHTVEIDIKPFCDLADTNRDLLMKVFPKDDPRTAANLRLASENQRARQRMCMLYDFGQAHRLLVLGTGNLDEYLLGYFTKYGDGASDIEPLLYCLKREVRTLGEYLGIPKSILACAPSAELSDGQTDEADLGFSYDEFDDLAMKCRDVVPATVEKIVRRVRYSAHKRKWPPAFEEPVLDITR